jgi:hypothetical protein
VTPGAPGVYINERAGNVAFGNITSFSTVYMLVEAEESVPVTTFPFNTPVPVTTLADYRALLGGVIPTQRIPELSYNCVNEFFANSQVGDLRVVRVGTPNQIVEIEFLPSATKLNSTSLPSALMAGNKVYVQMILNGNKLVAGDGSTGYTANGEWLGVPVEIPVNYVAGDEVNNRKISAAIATAVAAAIESNPSVRSSVYVRDFGLVNDLNPSANSENSYVTIAATTFDGTVNVVTEVFPVGTNFVFMQNAYDIQNIVGESVNLERVPQDYVQCIDTAFDTQQDQGYLVTPTAYAQFDAAGRAAVGAAAATHCESNNFKWMALADPGPYLVTDVNKYSNYVPHQAAADLVQGLKYLVDNAIYEWTGENVSYSKLTYQTMVFGESAQTAVNESANIVADGIQVGLLDGAQYTINAVPSATDGIFVLNSTQYWPVTLPIQEVTLSGVSAGNDFTQAYVRGLSTSTLTATGPLFNIKNLASGAGYPNGTFTNVAVTGGSGAGAFATVTVVAGAITSVTITNGGNGYTPADTGLGLTGYAGTTFDAGSVDTLVNLQGTVLVIAPPYDSVVDSNYSQNYVFLATSAVDAANIYNAVVLAGGAAFVTNPPIGAAYMPVPSSDTAQISYTTPNWDLPVDINGQTSDLIENISGASAGVNTLHLPGTLQNATDTYRLDWVSRTILNPSAQVIAYPGTVSTFVGSAQFTVVGHGLRSGQKIFFTQPITATAGSNVTNIVSQTTKLVSRPYWVKVIDVNTFVVANSLANYTVSSFVAFPAGATVSTYPSILYSQALGGGITTISSIELLTIPMVRGRKYEFDSSSIFNAAANAAFAPGSSTTTDPGASFYLNNSSVILGEDQITPYGEDLTSGSLCGWLPSLNLVNPSVNPVPSIGNAYCVPTVDQFFQPEAFFVPAIDPILGGQYNAAGAGADGPLVTVNTLSGAAVIQAPGTYFNVAVTGGSGIGTGALATVVVSPTNIVTSVTITAGGNGYATGDTGLGLVGAGYAGFTMNVATISAVGAVVSPSGYALQAGVVAGDSGNDLVAKQSRLVGVYFNVTSSGVTPDGTAAVVNGDRIVLQYNGSVYTWAVIPAASLGGDLTVGGQPCYGAQVELVFTPEQTPAASLWRFDAITSSEIISNALRGVGFNGVPQAAFVEAGVDNVNRLYDDSQRYSNPFGFIAYYGPYIENASGQWIPPSPYVTGVAVRRYRAEGYQFPPAGVKYQLADAVGTQIPINSAQQNLLNPDGCNAIRSLPGYPQSAVFIWGGRTRVNPNDAQQKLYQFVNTRVILNVVYGSLRTAFDSQIFNVIDGFGVIFNQIISVGNSILNQLYVRGALFGARPSDAFQVICDNRINSAADLENGIVNAKVFVTPVPTLERIQIDLIRVAIGQMQNELDSQGLGSNNG